MVTCNPDNERLKRRYLVYLREAKGYSEASLDGVAAALHRFEEATKFRDFKKFHIQAAVAFKRRLLDQVSTQTGERLSNATVYAVLVALKNFFHWLAGQPGFRSRLTYADAEYFNLMAKETSVAKARREPRVPTMEQVKTVIAAMPAGSDIERRNRALVAFTLLTGARDGALASFKLKHVDLEQRRVTQDARDVKTKFSKTFVTYFFPVGEEIEQIVVDWVEYLRGEVLWGEDDPLFPATQMAQDTNRQFVAAGLARRHWSNATPIRKIFRTAFTAASLPYFAPHSFRKTLVGFGEKQCKTPEEFKAYSQNLGHEHVMTTFTSYGQVASTRQAELIRGLSRSAARHDDLAAKIRAVLESADPAV